MRRPILLSFVIILFLIIGSFQISGLKIGIYDEKVNFFCLKNQSTNFTNKFHYMLYDFRIRSYLIHIPPSYNKSNEVPLLILLHGSFFNANSIKLRSEMDKKADEENFIVVYPNGASGLLFKIYNKIFCGEPNDRYWNAGFCGGLSYLLGIDDVGYIDAIIERIQIRYNINSSRIYVSGFSSGAILTYYIGAKLSHKIAAIAPVAGIIGGKPNDFLPLWLPPNPDNPISLIIFNGLKDQAIPYEGGKAYALNKSIWAATYLSVNKSVNFWIENNNCSRTPIEKVSENGNVTVRNYINGENGSEILLYTINNGKHYWFGSTWDDGYFPDPYKEISATNIMWDFFEKHPKN